MDQSTDLFDDEREILSTHPIIQWLFDELIIV